MGVKTWPILNYNKLYPISALEQEFTGSDISDDLNLIQNSLRGCRLQTLLRLSMPLNHQCHPIPCLAVVYQVEAMLFSGCFNLSYLFCEDTG